MKYVIVIGKKLRLFLFKMLKIIFNPYKLLVLLRTFFIDFRYGMRYLGISLNNENKKLGFVYTGSTEYSALNVMFSQIELNSNDVIVDVGCGKGRTFNWLLYKKVTNKLIGIEVDHDVAKFTKKRLSNYPQIEIIVGNFCDITFPRGASIFYLYNPFKEELMRKFVKYLLDIVVSKCYKYDERPLIIYHNCDFLYVFEENPAWVIKRLGYINGHLSAIIWYNDQGRIFCL